MNKISQIFNKPILTIETKLSRVAIFSALLIIAVFAANLLLASSAPVVSHPASHIMPGRFGGDMGSIYFFPGGINVTTNVTASKYCIGTSCITAWSDVSVTYVAGSGIVIVGNRINATLGDSITHDEIISVNASRITVSTLPTAVLPATVSLLGQSIEHTEITDVNASRITVGTIPVARIPLLGPAQISGGGTFGAGNYAFPGNLTIAHGLGIGTTPIERLDVAGAIKVGDTSSPCDASRRGVIKFVQGGSGTADSLLVCKKRVDDTYAWVHIGSGIGGFRHRRKITISNSYSYPLHNYQVLVTLDTASLIAAGKMRSDCGDVRFVDTDETLLTYALASGCNTASTKFWVRVPHIPAAGSKSIYVYYGNPDASSASKMWHNIKHLNIYDGIFNYHAAFGVNGYHSRHMQHRLGVAAGDHHTCALLTNGNVDCWGKDYYGETNDYFGSDGIGIAAGTAFTCVLTMHGNVHCWGKISQGYTGGNAIGIAAGITHVCALLTNGNVVCWGSGVGARNYTGGNAIAVGAGYLFSCALLSNGNVVCWGHDALARNYTKGDAIGIGIGFTRRCVILSNGNVNCWDKEDLILNYTGGDAIGVAVNADICILRSNGDVDCRVVDYTGKNAIGVAVGWSHECALLADANIDCWGTTGPEGNDYTGGNARNPFRTYMPAGVPEPTISVGAEE